MENYASSSERQTHLLAVCAVVSFCSAALAGSLVYHNESIHDPIDVVGLPLLQGYSERSEQLGWFVFWGTSVAVTGLGCAFARQRAIFQVAGGGAGLIVVAVYLASILNTTLVLLVFATTLAMVAARTHHGFEHNRTSCRRIEFTLWSLLLGSTLYRWFGYLLGVFVVPQVLAAAIIICGWIYYIVVTRTALRELVIAHIKKATKLEWLPIVIAAVVFSLLPNHLRVFVPCLIAAALFGQVWAGRRPGHFNATTGALGICVLGTLAWFAHHRPIFFPMNGDIVILLTLSIAIGLSMPSLPRRYGASLARTCQSLCYSHVAVALVSVCIFGVNRWWSASLIVGLIFVVFSTSKLRRPSFANTTFIIIVLLFAFLPSIRPAYPIDPYHEGQILSAVWEFEGGKTIYSEVFPLRGFSFWVCWLGRLVLPHTVECYRASTNLLGVLPVIGAFGIGFAWTRSSIWGLAFALTIACAPMDGRQGTLLVLAAVVLQVLMLGRRFWWSLMIPGTIACLVGFDAIGPIALGATGSAYLTQQLPLLKQPTLSQFVSGTRQGLIDGVLVCSALVLPFTLLILIWQGWDAAHDYWILFYDYAQHINSFYGLPLSLDTVARNRFLRSTLILVTLWNCAGICLCARLSENKCRGWWFLSMFVFLFSLRAVGRSDSGHFGCFYYATFLLSILLLFEAVVLIRQLGFRRAWTNRRNIAVAVTLYSLAGITHGEFTPITLVHEIRMLDPSETWELDSNSFVPDVVSVDESFWPVENGIATYAHQRRNPTRHAIAGAISTPDEQREAVRAMSKDPPKLIEWPTFSIDGIPVPLRYYIIAPYVYRNYQPSPQAGFLSPAPEDFRGVKDLPHSNCIAIDFGRLPWQWGTRRLPLLKNSILDVQSLSLSKVNPALADNTLPVWTCQREIDSFRYNYLLARVSFARDNLEFRPNWPEMTIRFSEPNEEFVDQDLVRFQISPNASHDDLLIPVGCSPGWSWRPAIGRIQIDCDSEGICVEGLQLLEIDEIVANQVH